jgi:hypothetical protein
MTPAQCRQGHQRNTGKDASAALVEGPVSVYGSEYGSGPWSMTMRMATTSRTPMGYDCIVTSGRQFAMLVTTRVQQDQQCQDEGKDACAARATTPAQCRQ